VFIDNKNELKTKMESLQRTLRDDELKGKEGRVRGQNSPNPVEYMTFCEAS